jgi:PAS domain S-box-containing protein
MAGTTAFTSPLLDLVFDDDAVGRCLVAPDGTVLRANGEWLRSTGLSLDDVLGADILELFPATRDMAGAMHARARAGHRVEVPRHVQRIRGVETWWEGRIEPVALEGGAGLLITTREASGTAPVSRHSYSATELADYMRDAGPAGIVLFEPAAPYRVLSTNKAYEQLWPEPLRTNGLVGRSLFEFVPDAEEAGVADVFRDVARTRATRHLEEFPYKLADGEHWFSWTVAPVIRDGELVALANMAVDITREVRARKEAERSRDASRREAELLELGDALCELDRDFRVVRVNERQEQLTGIPRAQSIGKTHWELWPETGQPGSPWWREYHRCMLERVPVQFENYYGPLGLWSNVTVYPTHSGGIAIFFRDVTERKRAEEALRSSAEKFSAAFHGNASAMALTRMRDGVVLDINEAYTKLLGYTRDDLVGRPPVNVWHSPEDRAAVFRDLERDGRAMTREVRVVKKGGEVWSGLLSAQLVTMDGERIIIASIVDITERKRAEEALRGANERLKEADRRKDEFLGMLSHELRNPLAPIRNSIYIMRHTDAGSDQAVRAQAVIERQTEHLTRLVDDLLDMTRIARGKIELRRARVDLRELVTHAADDFRLVMQDRSVAFDVLVPAEKLWADADPTRVTQMVGNLLHNASKFTRRGDRVILSIQRTEDTAGICVRDTGAGIEPGLLPNVFDPFVQGERTLARTEGGLGLGLALVKGIAELHGGTVRAESGGAGMGTEFVVTLPLASAGVELRRSVGVAPSGTGRRVLVVDDNADGAESLAELATVMGHTVDVALDGPTAVDMARANPPDVVLCDIGLPGMSGYDVARALRSSCGRTIRLVAVSGYAQPEDVERAIEAGFDGHIAKPPDPEEVERVLAWR